MLRKQKILLAIDIGNTNIVFGIFKDNLLVARKILPTNKAIASTLSPGNLGSALYKKEIDAVVISSVVPRALVNVKKALKDHLKCKIFVLGENITAPIKNRYKSPKQVGQDRLANGVAMYNRYKGGIVVDFGTAVTFDVISEKNEYLGGIIFPGISISLENLSLKAALLPKISLKGVKSLLGTDTTGSMRSGILNGYAALCDGIIAKIKKERGKHLRVLATGGDAALLSRYCRSIDRVDPDLTLKGLLITHQNR